MSNFKPFVYTIIGLFLLNLVVTLTVTPFVDTSSVSDDSILSNPIIYQLMTGVVQGDFAFIRDGLTGIIDSLFEVEGGGFFSIVTSFIGGFINIVVSLLITIVTLPLYIPSLILPFAFEQYLVNQINAISYIPDYVLIPLSILGMFALIWSVTKLILA